MSHLEPQDRKSLGSSALSPFLQASLHHPFLLAPPSPLPALTPAATDRHTAGPQVSTTHQNAGVTRQRDHKTETQLIKRLPTQAGARETFDSPGDGSAMRLKPHFQGRIEAIPPGNGLIDQPEHAHQPSRPPPCHPTLLLWALLGSALGGCQLVGDLRPEQQTRARPWADEVPLDKSQCTRQLSKDFNTSFSGVVRYHSVIMFITHFKDCYKDHTRGAFPQARDCEK